MPYGVIAWTGGVLARASEPRRGPLLFVVVYVYVSILFVRMLLSELRLRGLSEAALLEGSSVDTAALANLRATIPTAEWVALLVRAIELTGDPSLGIAMGETWSLSMLQVVGQLIVSCRTMREALSAFERYRSLLGNNSSWQLEERDDTAWLYCDHALTHPVAAHVSMEAVLTLTYRVGRGFSGHSAAAKEVWFSHAEPSYAAEFARVFDCPVRFGQPRNALVFARRALDYVGPHNDETMRELLRTSADSLLRERQAESLSDRVRALLRYEQDVSRMNVRHIASLLDMNVRALRRRLGAEHTPITTLLDEARLRVAQRELSRPEASIKVVAHQLGFSEPSAFHRAFRRWSGQTPAQFVKEQPGRDAGQTEPNPSPIQPRA
jgi:AraC-like DNA-binding protein